MGKIQSALPGPSVAQACWSVARYMFSCAVASSTQPNKNLWAAVHSFSSKGTALLGQFEQMDWGVSSPLVQFMYTSETHNRGQYNVRKRGWVESGRFEFICLKRPVWVNVFDWGEFHIHVDGSSSRLQCPIVQGARRESNQGCFQLFPAEGVRTVWGWSCGRVGDVSRQSQSLEQHPEAWSFSSGRK